MILLAVLNTSKHVKNADADAMVKAVAIQLARDVAPLLGIVPPGIAYYPDAASVPREASILTIQDAADVPDAAGMHTESSDGAVVGRVYVDPVLAEGGTLTDGPASVSCTFSHEVIEAIRNPFINLWIANFRDGYLYAREPCDPTENDDGYRVAGIAVSNFVTDAWGDSFAQAGARFDHLGNLAAPFGMTSGGYLSRMRPGSSPEQIFGSSYPAAKRARKVTPGSRCEALSVMASMRV